MKKLVFALVIATISAMVLLPLSTVTHSSGISKHSARAESNPTKANNAAAKDSARNSRDAMAVNSKAADEEEPVAPTRAPCKAEMREIETRSQKSKV